MTLDLDQKLAKERFELLVSVEAANKILRAKNADDLPKCSADIEPLIDPAIKNMWDTVCKLPASFIYIDTDIQMNISVYTSLGVSRNGGFFFPSCALSYFYLF